jgi:hypothetical protein
LAPSLDHAAAYTFADWLRIFQVVSPNITIPGGAAIVLSSILYASRSQLDNAARQAAEQKTRDTEAQLLAARTEAANILLDPPIPRTEAAEARAQAAEARLEAERLARRLAELESGAHGT